MGVIEEMARAETEELVNDCQVERELEIDELREENAKLRELLSMYVSFARRVSPSVVVHNCYPKGPGKRLSETEMRERALELGVKGCM